MVLCSRLGYIRQLWSVLHHSCWWALHRRVFLSVCLAWLLVPEWSRCALRQAASVFLSPLVGSFFSLSCWRTPSKVILATSCEVSCCSSDTLGFLFFWWQHHVANNVSTVQLGWFSTTHWVNTGHLIELTYILYYMGIANYTYLWSLTFVYTFYHML